MTDYALPAARATAAKATEVESRGVPSSQESKGSESEQARRAELARNQLIVRIHHARQRLKDIELAYLEVTFLRKRQRFEQLSDPERVLYHYFFSSDYGLFSDPAAGLKQIREDIKALEGQAQALGYDILGLGHPKLEQARANPAQQLAAYNARVEALRSSVSAGLLIVLGDVVTHATEGRSISTEEIDFALAYGRVVDFALPGAAKAGAKLHQRFSATRTAARGTETTGTSAGPIVLNRPPPAPALSRPKAPTTVPDKSPASAGGAAPPSPSSKPKAPTTVPDRSPVSAGGETPPPPRTTVEKLRQLKVDMDDPYTARKLAETYRDNRNPSAFLTATRGASGELRALVRAGKEPGVKLVRFLRPVNSDRTPDIEVVYRDGRRSFIEVRTLTRARQRDQVHNAKAPERRAPLPALIELTVEQKLRHGQISATRPGKFVFHAPFEKINSTALEGWREMLARITARSPMPEGIHRIEVTCGENAAMLIFQPPGWTGVLVGGPQKK